LIHAAHAKATQAIEQHIAPGYEAGFDILLHGPVKILKEAAESDSSVFIHRETAVFFSIQIVQGVPKKVKL
jgi:hypothetical protein